MFRVCVVTRYYPPYHAVTGDSAHELVDWLTKHVPDIEVSVAHVKVPYNEFQDSEKPVGLTFQINAMYAGKNKLLRLLSNVAEGFRLVRLASSSCDLVISLTDPPLLNIWTGGICKLKKIPWVYWSMDLYPHAFKAAHLVSEYNPVYRLLESCFKRFTPSFLIALGEHQAEFLQRRWPHRIPQVILPCGIYCSDDSAYLPDWKIDDRIYFAYAGNLGEAHDPDFVIDLVNSLDPVKHCCILALYGVKARKVMEAVQGNPAIIIVPSLTREELSYVDVHLVSLIDDWKNVCVPSKAVSAICAGQTIIFKGAQDSDTWHMLGDAGWIIGDKSEDAERTNISDVLAQVENRLILNKKKSNARIIRSNLFKRKYEALREMQEWIQMQAGMNRCFTTEPPEGQSHGAGYEWAKAVSLDDHDETVV